MEKKNFYHGKAALNHLVTEAQTRLSGGHGQDALMVELKRLYGAVDGLSGMAVNKDTTKPLDEHIRKISLAAQRFSEVLPKIRERVEKHINATRNDFEQGFIQNSGLRVTERSSEIRALVRSMNPTERTVFVLNLIKAVDGEGLGSIFMAPAYLTGLTPELASELKDHFFEKTLPLAWQAKQDFEFFIKHIEAAIKVADQAVLDFGTPDKLRSIEASQQAAEASQQGFDSSLGGAI